MTFSGLKRVPSLQHVGDRAAVDELHREERGAVLLAQVEERHDARVGERPRDLGLVLEARR